ncbi:MAG: hypothetical protein ACYDHX_01495 [Methanothrix sp.]
MIDVRDVDFKYFRHFIVAVAGGVLLHCLEIAKAIFFLIAATSEWKSPIIILLRYITSKITLLLQSYSLIFFVAILLPRKKKLEVYFSTGNKGVDGGDISP